LTSTADAWRKQHLSPTDYQRFKSAESSWEGSGQWGKNKMHRKAVNHIATKSIEGPPPCYANINTFIERGIHLTLNDFKEFIKPFEIGKKIYLGPSGFSLNSHTAKSFGGCNSTHNDGTVRVLLRVRPGNNKQIKAGVLAPFHTEQEVIYGTGKHSRVVAVTKHIHQNSRAVAYEIELQFDDSLNESVNVLGNDYGFQSNLWSGLSAPTVKMFIKYLNTPLKAIPKINN
jgi:hypothetical protein